MENNSKALLNEPKRTRSDACSLSTNGPGNSFGNLNSKSSLDRKGVRTRQRDQGYSFSLRAISFTRRAKDFSKNNSR
jgi:hypothetical protein